MHPHLQLLVLEQLQREHLLLHPHLDLRLAQRWGVLLHVGLEVGVAVHHA
jgi:hypothetical protein